MKRTPVLSCVIRMRRILEDSKMISQFSSELKGVIVTGLEAIWEHWGRRRGAGNQQAKGNSVVNRGETNLCMCSKRNKQTNMEPPPQKTTSQKGLSMPSSHRIWGVSREKKNWCMCGREHNGVFWRRAWWMAGVTLNRMWNFNSVKSCGMLKTNGLF